MSDLLGKIFRKIKKEPWNFQHYENLYFMCLEAQKLDKDKKVVLVGENIRPNIRTATKYLKRLSEMCESQIVKSADGEMIRKLHNLRCRALKAAAEDDLDSFLLYVEMKREPERKFYAPRRAVLKTLVDDLQDLADGRLEFLGISLPPRIGKSTLCIFFMTWIMGKRPDVANVMSGHSDKLTEGFYRELLAILTDSDTYQWADVFPGLKIADTSAKNETIDLGKKSRFPTMTCRSVSGTLTGAVEVGSGGILYCDDLVEDLEESLNPVRLQAKYNAYLNQLKDRKKLGAVELMVGTRWNVYDPLGMIQAQYAGNDKYRFRVIPALNEENESNFNYPYGLGFDTKYYLDMKDSIDDATWNAKYQGSPYVREGLLFPSSELKYYNGVLPDGDPMIISVCDVAWGGGDALSMPIAYVYGEDVYIHDVVFNRGDKAVTQPVVTGRAMMHKPHKMRFEANNGGSEYAAKIDEMLKENGFRTNVSSKKAPSSSKSMRGGGKVARIIQFAPDIKRFYFIDDKYRSKEYREFMKEVTTFVQTGKNEHDDACDSLAMLADELFHGEATVQIMQRPW